MYLNIYDISLYNDFFCSKFLYFLEIQNTKLPISFKFNLHAFLMNFQNNWANFKLFILWIYLHYHFTSVQLYSVVTSSYWQLTCKLIIILIVTSLLLILDDIIIIVILCYRLLILYSPDVVVVSIGDKDLLHLNTFFFLKIIKVY